MVGKIVLTLSIFVIFVSKSSQIEIMHSNTSLALNRYENNAKSSLVFVFDTTGSMYNDLKQLREGAEMILNTALEEGNVIEDFVFVPFHDPAVGPATVTKDKEVFKAALNIVRVYGGGNCPEMSLGGIRLGLSVSRPRSYVYVFTDASAYDHRLVGQVLDSVQRKQSQEWNAFADPFGDKGVVFILTGHCNDLQKPSFKVYQQIAAASSGQVFNLNKTSVHKVLEFVRTSIRGRMVNLGSVVNPAGYNFTQGIPIDKSLAEVTVSVSGANPSIRVVNPSGKELTGPPKLITTLDLSEIMVVKVLQPEPGNWTITTGSEEDHSVKVVGLSNLTFNHGFSVERPMKMEETSYRPLQGAYNYMMIALTETNRPLQINYAEILTLGGKMLFEIPLREVDSERKMYLADPFLPPDEFFYISINGHDEYNQELRRIGATAVQAKPPDAPYLTVLEKIVARAHQRVVLRCNVESLVPITAMWTKDAVRIQPLTSSLQTTSIEHVIEDMGEGDVGIYRCVAKNVAGLSKAITEVFLIADPPQVSISPENKTVEIGEDIEVSCTVISEALLLKYQLMFNGTEGEYVKDIHSEPSLEGLYKYTETTRNSQRDTGIYSCLAANRGGQTVQSTYITVKSEPTAQILGPHTLTKPIHSAMQMVCHVENAHMVAWMSPNGTVVKEREVSGSGNDMLDVNNVKEDGAWSCIAVRGSYRANDSVEINILIKPEAHVEGSKNVTILNGTSYEIVCNIVAKPKPRIIWHKETEKFLNNTVLLIQPNTYKSVLKLDSAKENVNDTYFCIGENSEGIDQDSVTVRVRRKMTLIEGFSEKSLELYSQVELPCRVDSYPPATIRWYHNGTDIKLSDNVQLSRDNNTLYIKRMDFQDFGPYMCESDNGFEKLSVEGNLNVHGLDIPTLSKEPIRKVTQRGKSTIITCRVLKGNPEPTFTWQYRRNDSSQFTTLPKDVKISDNRSELIIPGVEIDHWGVYRCVAENVVGKDAYEVLLVVQYPPLLTNETEYEKPLEVRAGGKVVFSCMASGVPPPLITWTKDNRPVSYSRNVYLTDGSELVIDAATEYDSGLFTCTATSALGSSRKNFTLVVYVPPVISPPGIEPEIEALEGQLVELPCSAKGVPKPEIMWLQNGNVIAEDRKYIDNFGLRFVANLTDFGEYNCVAKNEYGNATLTFTLYIWVAPYMEPPQETTVDVSVGSNVTLHCDTVGFPIPSITWEFRGEVLRENTTELSFNDVGNFFINNASARHEGLFVCIAENVAGAAMKFIHLSVNDAPKILLDNYTGPYIATDKDTSLAISCRATGKPKPFVIWSKDNIYLDKDSRYDIDTDGTLTIKSPTEDLSGMYTCIAKNAIGAVNKSVPVEIYAIPSPIQAEESQQTAVTALEGTNVTVHCPIRASQADKVKWYKDAVLISEGTLQILNISRHNSSSYACVVTNTVGSAYSKVKVNVEWAPVFVGKGGDVEVVRGDDWYFECAVDAKPAAKTKWLFNSKLLLGEDKSRLKLLNIQLRHVGTYKCVVSNPHGTISKQYTLDVLVPPFISEFGLLDVQLKEGMNATLECNARGSPKPEIKWTFNNTNWQIENSTLIATNISTSSEGLIRCDAVNKAGMSHIVYRVGVVQAARVEEITAFDGSSGETLVGSGVAVLGSHIRIACKASGKPTPTIQWLRNGNTVGENSPGIGYADLTYKSVDKSHAGLYVCVASNEGGVDERKIKLDVLEPPQIFQSIFQNENLTENSMNLEVLSGQAFYLHCHPSGNPLPEVYWFRDGVPLRLFDDTMVSMDYGEVMMVKEAKFEQSGNYTCVARSSVGEASFVYLVDVLVPPPTPKEASNPVVSRVGKQLTLTCPAEGSPLPAVKWIKHPYSEINENTTGFQIVNENFTLLLNKTEVSDSGRYSCVLTNKVGTTEVVFDVTVEKAPSIAGSVVGDAESHAVALRRSVVLKCQVDGNPLPKISWLKDTQRLSSKFNDLSNTQTVLGNSLLAIWSVDTRDAGQYICVAENSAGTAHRRYNLAVQVPGKWSSWTQWSLCNVSCGLGYQHRARSCQYLDDYNVTYDKTTKSDKIILDESLCKGPTSDRRKCHMPSCEEDETRWSLWSKWSACSATCGVGTQARTRRCRTRGRCYGDNVQIRKCLDLPKCSSSREASENGSYGSTEDNSGTSAYIPEATFEQQPEIVNTQYSTDVEEFYIKPGPKYSTVYYDVNVTGNLDRSDRGSCEVGYRPNTTMGSCEDIDECLIEQNHCHSTQACENTPGGYRCSCPKGFASLGVGQRCLDINECEQEISGCEYACVNVAGGYVCACPARLRLHVDRHHCVPPPSYRKPYSFEDLENDDYLSTSLDYPAKYLKNTRN